MSYTPRNRFNKQDTGSNTNTWGVVLNDQVFELVDDALDGLSSKALTISTSLSSANGADDESRYRMLKFTGTGGLSVTIPSVEKWYIVWNATSSGTVTITTGAGTTVVVDNGDMVLVFCDGTNVKTLGYGGYSIKDYIAAATVSEVELPAQTGNGGKYLQTDGSVATWQAPASTDLSDYATNIKGLQIALAVAL